MCYGVSVTTLGLFPLPFHSEGSSLWCWMVMSSIHSPIIHNHDQSFILSVQSPIHSSHCLCFLPMFDDLDLLFVLFLSLIVVVSFRGSLHEGLMMLMRRRRRIRLRKGQSSIGGRSGTIGFSCLLFFVLFFFFFLLVIPFCRSSPFWCSPSPPNPSARPPTVGFLSLANLSSLSG